ncbi:hypothetical protein B0H11DRAFT_2308060 [Mycena galericulata]|nr:hypothetical protein B0H11DRAFT_2308060 [Mycena galericulata]
MYMFGLVKTGNGIKISNGKKARLFTPRAQRVEESGGSRGRERVLRQWQAAGRSVAKRQRMRRLSAAMRVEHGEIPPAAVNRGKNKREKWAAEGDARERRGERRLACMDELPASREGVPRRMRRIGARSGARRRRRSGREAAAAGRFQAPADAIRVRRRPQASRRVTAGAPTRIEWRSGVDDDERRRRTTSVLPMGGPEKSFREAAGAEQLLRGVPAEGCPCAQRIQGSIHEDPGSEESMNA